MSRSSAMLVPCVVLVASAAVAGPASQYVLTAGDNRTNWIVQGAGVVTSWSTGSYFEYPVAVLDTIRTAGADAGEVGAEYTLAGVATGTTFTNGLTTGHAYDAATDGTNIYMINWSTGDVVRCGLDYSSPQVLFNLGNVEDHLGITYDATNSSLWISAWNEGTIADYSLAGALLSSFTVPYTSITCLALDPSDNTLWFGSQQTEGTFYQYSRAGASLSTQSYPALASQNTLGGEFQAGPPREQIPALGGTGLAALALALAGAGWALLRRRG